MRVDFPAPFSPQIAWISPRSTLRVTSFSTLTPGKFLTMLRISRIASLIATPVISSQFGLAGSRRGLFSPRREPRDQRGSARDALGDLVLGPVARVNEQRLDRVGRDDVRLEQERGDDLHAVVVRLGVVRFRLLTLRVRRGGLDGLRGDLAGGLEARSGPRALVSHLSRP